jgi:transcriptional regulator
MLTFLNLYPTEVVSMLTRQEKEQRVLDLYNQGKTIREIAKELRMSFRDIGAILKKASGELEEKEGIKDPLSRSNKAYRLFSKGKTPIQVAITLNLSDEETIKFYQEYLNLKQMHELRIIYEEIGADIASFLRLYKLSKDAKMNPRQIVNLLHIANNDLLSVQQRYQKLQRNVRHLEFKEIDLSINLEDMNDQIRNAKKMLHFYHQCSRKEVNKTLQLRNQNMELDRLLRDFKNNNRDYNKIQFVARQTVKSTLSDKRQWIKLALYSLLESWRADPTKFNSLIHFESSTSMISNSTMMNYSESSCYDATFSSCYNQNSYTDNLIEIIVNGASSLYDKLVKDFTNETIANAVANTNSNLLLSMTHLNEQTDHTQALVYRHITKTSIYDQ